MNLIQTIEAPVYGCVLYHEVLDDIDATYKVTATYRSGLRMFRGEAAVAYSEEYFHGGKYEIAEQRRAMVVKAAKDLRQEVDNWLAAVNPIDTS